MWYLKSEMLINAIYLHSVFYLCVIIFLKISG